MARIPEGEIAEWRALVEGAKGALVDGYDVRALTAGTDTVRREVGATAEVAVRASSTGAARALAQLAGAAPEAVAALLSEREEMLSLLREAASLLRLNEMHDDAKDELADHVDALLRSEG